MRGNPVLGLAAASLGVALSAAPGGAPQGRVYGHENIKRQLQKWGRSRRRGNSPAGYSHDHKREIARRLRQAERDRENRLARAEQEATRNGFGRSRRGLLVDCSK